MIRRPPRSTPLSLHDALPIFGPKYNTDADSSEALLCYVDVDNQAMQSVCQKHGVSCMPTLVFIKGGEQKDKMEGVDQAKYTKWKTGEC